MTAFIAGYGCAKNNVCIVVKIILNGWLVSGAHCVPLLFVDCRVYWCANGQKGPVDCTTTSLPKKSKLFRMSSLGSCNSCMVVLFGGCLCMNLVDGWMPLAFSNFETRTTLVTPKHTITLSSPSTGAVFPTAVSSLGLRGAAVYHVEKPPRRGGHEVPTISALRHLRHHCKARNRSKMPGSETPPKTNLCLLVAER